MLSGGGARAAYQVGVIQAISEWFPRAEASPFSIYCGASAGALNVTALACHASCFTLGAKKLTRLWRNLKTQDVFSSSVGGMLAHIGRQTFSRMQADYHVAPSFALLNNRPLRHLLYRVIHYHRLEQQILSGHLHGIAVTAANYQSGKSVTFFQGCSSIKPWQRARSQGVHCQLNTEHLLASSAIPIVFPASRIGHSFYGDGSIHLISPLRPALKLGADKVLCIDLGVNISAETPGLSAAPGLAALGGHLMDAIFADTLSADIEHLERMNSITAAMPPETAKKLELRQVDALYMSPSKSFDPLVKSSYTKMPIATRGLMRILGLSPQNDATLTSYLLFEQQYISELIDMGYQDAQNRRSELMSFLFD
ncbi:patatin-like phospholipase family protein [Veronia pacifica]|uniref:Patatin n=1 Tax=Veronia pacifica TaxID=1080227 RepID=A0A1C3EI94_9GAMM|nr:Patatin [Veronia pacifica]